MRETRQRFLVHSMRAADLAAMTIAFGIAFIASGRSVQNARLDEFLMVRVKLANVLVFAAFVLFWHLIFRSFGLYRSFRAAFVASEWWNITKATAIGTLVLSGLAFAFDLSVVDRVFLLTFFAVALPTSIVERAALTFLLIEDHHEGRYLRNLVIVGCGPRGAAFGSEVRRRPELGYLLLGYVDEIAPPNNPLHVGVEKLLGPPSRAREIFAALRVDEVFISLPIKSHYETIAEILALCRELDIDVQVPADFFESRLVHAHTDELHHTPVLTLEDHTPGAAGAVIKRLIDVVVSSFALVVLSPALAVIALAIKIDSEGPVFFVQQRVGLHRKVLQVVKFRTMRVDAEKLQEELEDRNEAGGAAFKIAEDPRMTRVGRPLRKLSLDELPQLWNVLEGDMSLVGPRPLPIRDVMRFEQNWPQRRFSVKPGLTCLWQISGRHEIDFDNWMELDLEYIDNWSLSLDLDILMKTLPAVVGRHGAS